MVANLTNMTIGLLCIIGLSSFGANVLAEKCPTAPLNNTKISTVIDKCQDEIKAAIVAEALLTLQEDGLIGGRSSIYARRKREAFSSDETKIAGCLLHCVYRRMNAVDNNDFPTSKGLYTIFTDNFNNTEYLKITYEASENCVKQARDENVVNGKLKNVEKTCDIAFDIFECITSQLSKYCSAL